MLLTENAQPGQKFLIAVRVVAADEVQAEFFHSELTIEPPQVAARSRAAAAGNTGSPADHCGL